MEKVSESEIVQLDQLRENIKDLQLSSEYLENKNLVRWLRARNHSLKESEKMIRNNCEWLDKMDWKEMEITLSVELKDEGWNDLFPCALTGFDYQQCPVFAVKVGEWDVEAVMREGKKDQFINYVIILIEKVWAACTIQFKENKDIQGQFVGIYDLKGLTWRQVSSSQVVDSVIFLAQIFEAHFPESLKRGIILNAPWMFQIAWKLIRPFVSERTRSKLLFLGSDVNVWRDEISQIMPTKQFPLIYGGDAEGFVSKVGVSEQLIPILPQQGIC